jgi:PPM family protein phosphatase
MNHDRSIWAHCLQHAAKSDVGLRRANNQDSLAIAPASSQDAWEQRGHVFMVADGMGAHAAGELASQIATTAVPLAYQKLADRSPSEALLEALTDANRQIHNRGQASPEFKGMGTTATALVLLPQGAVLGHVGDSRAYRLRGNRFEQLTFDHSLVWEMRKAGQIPEDDVPGFISKNIITRSLGPNPAVQVDLEGPFPLAPGDAFLLCSDGLSGQVKDDEMGAILATLPPEEAVQTLVDLANLRGGPDNITVIVARVLGPQIAKDAASGSQPAAAPPSGKPVHPAIWAVLAVFALAAVGLLVLKSLLPALACLIGAVVTALVAAILRFRDGGGGAALDGRPLGRGPYVSCDCSPNAQLVERFKDTAQQLRDAATNEDWSVDWHRFNGHLNQATAATGSGDFTQATREYLRAIAFMMAQLKNQHRPGSDSSIDL